MKFAYMFENFAANLINSIPTALASQFGVFIAPSQWHEQLHTFAIAFCSTVNSTLTWRPLKVGTFAKFVVDTTPVCVVINGEAWALRTSLSPVTSSTATVSSAGGDEWFEIDSGCGLSSCIRVLILSSMNRESVT